jgi:hypothetical protein
MQIHTCSDQTKPQQKISFWTDILADSNVLQRNSSVAWVDEEGGEV